MPQLSIEAGILIVLALFLGFLNGRNDAANVVATVISTDSLRPRRALLVAAIAESIGPFVFGVAVATTIGKEVVLETAVTLPVVYATVLAAILWNMVTLTFGIPSSTSHALIGGLLGAAAMGFGLDAIQLAGVAKIVLSLLVSPVLGMLAGYLAVKLSRLATVRATPHVRVWFRRGQILSMVTLALTHGGNDAQKTMGIITLALVATGTLTTFAVPQWVILISAAAIALGTLFGGLRVIRTLGAKFYRVRPIHGFGAQAASTGIILGAALVGGPVSTTHVVSAAIVGAGSADRIQMVRWQVVDNIIWSWFLTIPAATALGGLLYLAFEPLLGS